MAVREDCTMQFYCTLLRAAFALTANGRGDPVI
jgi:hypothetical protein